MFKVGDRVVCTESDNYYYGNPGKVTYINEPRMSVIYSDGIEQNWYVDNYVLEEVYNSPLYKAMEEK